MSSSILQIFSYNDALMLDAKTFEDTFKASNVCMSIETCLLDVSGYTCILQGKKWFQLLVVRLTDWKERFRDLFQEFDMLISKLTIQMVHFLHDLSGDFNVHPEVMVK